MSKPNRFANLSDEDEKARSSSDEEDVEIGSQDSSSEIESELRTLTPSSSHVVDNLGSEIGANRATILVKASVDREGREFERTRSEFRGKSPPGARQPQFSRGRARGYPH